MKKEDIRYGESCVFEGMMSISAVLTSDSTDRRIIRVLYDAERARKLARPLSFLRRKAEERGFEIVESDAETVSSLSVGNSHGGIIAECTGRTVPELTGDLIVDGGFYVYIDGVEDPYNFGYALRSLYAAGADAVILPERNWMTAAGVVCRSSAGASELMPLYTAPSGMCGLFRKRGYKILCADTERSVSVYDTDCKKPLLLVVGGEKRGITRDLLDEADAVVHIDYGRPFKASLSAASAAAVLGFEIMRQNR